MNAGAVSIAVIMTLGLLAIIAVRGLAHFWPADVIVADYSVPGAETRVLAGEVVQAEEVPRARLAASGLPVNVEGGEFMTRELLKVGNREVYGADFSWVVGEWLSNQRTPAELMVLERREWGNFYGFLLNVKEAGQLVAEGEGAWNELQARIDRVDELHTQISRIEKVEIGRINHGLERLRLKTRKLELDDRLDAAAQADLDAERASGMPSTGCWKTSWWRCSSSSTATASPCAPPTAASRRSPSARWCGRSSPMPCRRRRS